MSRLTLRNPWVFTTVNAVVWALVWGTVQSLMFDGDAFWAAVEAGLLGIVFSMLYLYFGRDERQKKP